MAAPEAPINITATAGDAEAVVAFTPGMDGGSPVTSFAVTAENLTNSANGGQTATGASSPILITGLTNHEGHTFTVTATNADGTSPASDPSNLVIPLPGDETPSTDPLPNAVTVEVTKPVNMVQLDDEISAALSLSVNMALRQDDASRPISVTNPATLFIQPNTVNLTTVNSVITAHVLNPNYGTPVSITAFNEVTQKVVSNYDVELTADEMEAAVKGLLLRMYLIPSITAPNSPL